MILYVISLEIKITRATGALTRHNVSNSTAQPKTVFLCVWNACTKLLILYYFYKNVYYLRMNCIVSSPQNLHKIIILHAELILNDITFLCTKNDL